MAWFRRQALHAWILGLVHPATREWLECRAPLPVDLEQLLAILSGQADVDWKDAPHGADLPAFVKTPRSTVGR